MHAAFSRAVDAVGAIGERDIQKLPLPDCAAALSALPDIPELAAIRRRLAAQLQKQLRLTWVKKGDLYEVFAVLTALWQYDSASVTGEYLAGAIRRLVAAEIQVGGPYYSANAVAANIQIAIFMRLVAKPLPHLDMFLADIIAKKSFKDARLRRSWLLYLLAKAGKSQQLTRYIVDHWQQKSWQTPERLAVALLVFQIDSADTPPFRQALGTLYAQQRPDGLWPARPGSDADLMTTAVIIEMLARFQPAHIDPSRSVLEKERRVIIRHARRAFSRYIEPLRTPALQMIDDVVRADRNFEITLMPRLFARSLRRHASLPDQQYITLCLASLCGWIAYTIYDDFLDGEGQPIRLPIANVAMRTSLGCFETAIPDQANFHQYVDKAFAEMDQANAWEVNHCRFSVHGEQIEISRLPRYGKRMNLARRSFAHALAPMAILVQDTAVDTRQIRRIESAFRHYLIARQLNDDLHDWVQDMRTGQASYVVTSILRDARIQPGTYDLSVLMPVLQRRFRRTTMPKVCRHITRHLQTSRNAFEKSQLLWADNNVYALLDQLELSVCRSQDTHAKAQALVGVGRSARG